MKIPDIFVPEKKSLEENIERLIKQTGYQKLLTSCGKFLKETIHGPYTYSEIHEVGTKIAERVAYTKIDVEELSRTISMERWKMMFDKQTYDSLEEFSNPEWSFQLLGVYLSALVNKIITEHDTITLSPTTRLHGLGVCLKKGTVIVDSDTGDGTGYNIEGGKLIIKGNVTDFVGTNMKKNGEIHVEGENFGIENINKTYCHGRIYHKDKLVWPQIR